MGRVTRNAVIGAALKAGHQAWDGSAAHGFQAVAAGRWGESEGCAAQQWGLGCAVLNLHRISSGVIWHM